MSINELTQTAASFEAASNQTRKLRNNMKIGVDPIYL